MKVHFKKNGNIGFFDKDFALEALNSKRNILERISKVINFELFRPILEDAVLNKNKKNNSGAKPYDPVLLFKILILQRIYNLSDEATEYQIIDRLSFKNFLGLASGDKVPDQNTIWSFREKLGEKDTVSDLFNAFHALLQENGLMINEGKMIDATFVEAPRQRNTREENEKIKAGQGDELWNDQPHKKCQKDIDARWTKKNGQTYYGYKNHVKADPGTKLITNYVVTDASVHDSQVLEDLLEESDANQPLYADSAYTGALQDEIIEKYDMVNQVNEKGYKGKPLTDTQKANNRIKSKTRARVEHIFGFMEQSMHRITVRCVGLARSFAIIGLDNLVYNMCRYEQIIRLSSIKG